ncbi:hypothetical protein [Clostridium sporogenes]|uniref:hypothetical protein n=1 Tax=Clostridium sporogenes TaxID=1509 RepID=UPI0013D3FBD4|nr:hypothetical protein [Clostridium sporogenes]
MEKTLKEKKEIVIDSLVEFIKKATKEGATSDEVAALPEVAALVLEFNHPFHP